MTTTTLDSIRNVTLSLVAPEAHSFGMDLSDSFDLLTVSCKYEIRQDFLNSCRNCEAKVGLFVLGGWWGTPMGDTRFVHYRATESTVEASEAKCLAWAAERDSELGAELLKRESRKATRRARIAACIARPGGLTIPDGILES